MPTKQILLVDDEPEFRRIHALALRHAGFGVLEASCGLDAVQAAHEHVPDLILLDLRLPGMDGREAVDLIRLGGRTAHLPVVALSAYGPPDGAGGRAAGFNGFLPKPVDPRRTVEVARGWLGPTGAG